jgi:DNA-directed RNA polymerase specialized sigma24 family protein
MATPVGSVRAFPFVTVALNPAAPIRVPDPSEWPALWARCWSRIRTWQVPPRWSQRDWWDEARAQGALAACKARRSFEPGRLVPLEAYLYRRVVESVWTRYRQEWSFGRRCRLDTYLADRPVEASDGPDPESLARLVLLLGNLPEADRSLIRQLFWDGRTEETIAADSGLSRQAVNWRKQRILRRLRSELASEILDTNVAGRIDL